MINLNIHTFNNNNDGDDDDNDDDYWFNAALIKTKWTALRASRPLFISESPKIEVRHYGSPALCLLLPAGKLNSLSWTAANGHVFWCDSLQGRICLAARRRTAAMALGSLSAGAGMTAGRLHCESSFRPVRDWIVPLSLIHLISVSQLCFCRRVRRELSLPFAVCSTAKLPAAALGDFWQIRMWNRVLFFWPA